jgi:short-subunit dehydrogenase
MLQSCFNTFGKIDIVLIAHGTLSNQSACENNVQMCLEEFSTNCLSVISLLTLLANHMEKQQHGTIAVISSVAGDRGRATNYVYGCAKAAVTSFCSGLRARLFKSHVHVLTIKPGFVDTPMTQNLTLPKMLVATPDKIANDIINAVQRKKNTLYTPWFWAIIMLIIKLMPEGIFKKMKL